MSAAFTAQWAGVCGACTERFAAGDLIRFIEDDACHDDCEDRRVTGKAEKVCGQCFLTSCDCEAGG